MSKAIRWILILMLWMQGGMVPASEAVDGRSVQVQLALWEQLQGSNKPRVAGSTLQAVEAIQTFYLQRVYAAAWSHDAGILDASIDGLFKALKEAEQEGLNTKDYHIERLQTMRGRLQRLIADNQSLEPAMLATFDLLLTDAFLAYGTHLQSGRFAPERIGGGPHTAQETIHLPDLLSTALATGNTTEALRQLIPPQAGYAQLRTTLAHYRALAARGGWPAILEGAPLRPMERDRRVITLRARLKATGDMTASTQAKDETLYDRDVEQGVRTFQERHGLPLDGVVGEQTLVALNVPVGVRIQQIRQNMDRWRWLPESLGKRHILVNIPDFSLVVMEHDKPQLAMRVVVGLPSWPTPTFSANMTYIVLRPDWGVPYNIAKKEILPRLRQNPGYLSQQNLQAWVAGEDGARRIDPRSVTWSQISSGAVRFRQEPGPRNPLGDVKFMFPNPYHVYLHDTPSRSLFAKPFRAFSHGCIRLEKPMDLAAYVLRDNKQWTPERVQAVLAKRTSQTVSLPEPIPVHLVYRTAWIDDSGKVQFRPDLYGHDTPSSDSAS